MIIFDFGMTFEYLIKESRITLIDKGYINYYYCSPKTNYRYQ